MPVQIKNDFPRFRKLIDDLKEQIKLFLDSHKKVFIALADQYQIASNLYVQYYSIYSDLSFAIAECVAYAQTEAVDTYHWIRNKTYNVIDPLSKELDELVLKECGKARGGRLAKVTETDPLADQYDQSKAVSAKIIDQFANEKTYSNSAEVAEDFRRSNKKRFDQLADMANRACDIADKVVNLKNEMLDGIQEQGKLLTSLSTLIVKLGENLSPEARAASRQQFQQLKATESKQAENKVKEVQEQYIAFTQAASTDLSFLNDKWDNLEEKAVDSKKDSPQFGPTPSASDSEKSKVVISRSQSSVTMNDNSNSEHSKDSPPKKQISSTASVIQPGTTFQQQSQPSKQSTAISPSPVQQGKVDASCGCVMA